MTYAKRLRKPLLRVTEDGAYLLGVDREQAPLTQICIGIDPSLKGHALAVICDGEFEVATGWTDKKRLQQKCPETLNWFKLPTGRTEANSQTRIQLLAGWTLAVIGDYCFKLTRSDVYVAIEGYAFSKRGKGLHEIHGLVEMIKQGLWVKHIPFRIYSPTAVKMAWTGKGHATKDDMQRASEHYYAEGFWNEGSAGENLADATLIAGLLHTELELKAGRAKLKSLSRNMQKVMQRTTKSEPVSIIKRDFITPKESTAPVPVLGRPHKPRLLSSGRVLG